MKSHKNKKYLLADIVDRHELYELSVQNAESEIDFVDATYYSLRNKKAGLLREDFCGTANVCCEWVQRRKGNNAIGVDLDAGVLQWAAKNQVGKLAKKFREKIELIKANVLEVKTPPVDIVSAMNFSYWLLKEPKVLTRYFKSVRQALKPDGIFFLDAYGGYDAFREIEEDREVEGPGFNFTYIWEQKKFDPLINELQCRIHFEFEDGSALYDAFEYEWRLWTLPEIKTMLLTAGFRKVTFYWQEFDKHGEETGDFKPIKAGQADADAGWICYITAEN